MTLFLFNNAGCEHDANWPVVLQAAIDARLTRRSQAWLGCSTPLTARCAEQSPTSHTKCRCFCTQKELAEVKAERLEVEAQAEELATALEADLSKRAAELEDALATANVDAVRLAAQSHMFERPAAL